MNAFSSIDMGEVTRLTRAGRLSEAMALLQRRGKADRSGAGAAQATAERAAEPERSRRATDMVPPSAAGRAWTVFDSTVPQGIEAASPLGTPVRHPSLTEAMRALGIPNAKSGSLTNGSTTRQAPVPLPVGARFEDRVFANETGSRTYKVFVPSGYVGQALPVVVMLHGCTQSPDDFAAGTRMNELAEQQTFLVVYPAQPQSANLQKCWNWFKLGDQRRDVGEPSLIAGITRQVIDAFSADAARVYIAGLSAGGAAAAIMAATYPDLYAAVGVHSGLACGAARDMPSAFAAMNGKAAAQFEMTGHCVPTIVFHGDGDRTVHPVNGDHVIAQAMPRGKLGIIVTRGQTSAGMRYTRTVQTDDAGRELLEQWVVHGGGHAWFGGSPCGSYTDIRGPDASREMMRFFGTHTTRQ